MVKEKKPKDFHELVRLLNGWSLNLAYLFLEDGCMNRSEAMRQAHLTRKLLEAMGQGEVRFVYEKKDGTLREARGTLCHGISEAFDNYEYKTVPDFLNKEVMTFTYWDLDCEDFRSFSGMRLKSIEENRHDDE